MPKRCFQYILSDKIYLATVLVVRSVWFVASLRRALETATTVNTRAATLLVIDRRPPSDGSLLTA